MYRHKKKPQICGAFADRIPNHIGTTSAVTGHKKSPTFLWSFSCGPDPESYRDDLRLDRAQKKPHISVKLLCGPDPESVRDDLRRDRAQKSPTFL